MGEEKRTRSEEMGRLGGEEAGGGEAARENGDE